jgi:hypothetical protein
MRRAARVTLLAALMLAAPVVAGAESVCTQLLPIGLLPPAGGFTFGCTHPFSLKLGAAIGPDGNYILLGYPACANRPCAGLTGIAQLQCAADSGYFCCVSGGQMIPTIQGTNVGTFVAGLDQRIANDTDTRAGICHSAYVGNGSRVANVPVIQFIGADRTQAQVTGFFSVFVVGPPSGTGTATTVPVEFISDATPTLGETWGRLKILYR